VEAAYVVTVVLALLLFVASSVLCVVRRGRFERVMNLVVALVILSFYALAFIQTDASLRSDPTSPLHDPSAAEHLATIIPVAVAAIAAVPGVLWPKATGVALKWFAIAAPIAWLISFGIYADVAGLDEEAAGGGSLFTIIVVMLVSGPFALASYNLRLAVEPKPPKLDRTYWPRSKTRF
jgi:hypothetical protein